MKQIKTVTLDRNKKPTEEQIKQIEKVAAKNRNAQKGTFDKSQ